MSTFKDHPQSSYRENVWFGHKGYGQLVQDLTGCSAGEIGGIVRVMRDKFGTLDNLSRAEFGREARKARKVLLELWTMEYDCLDK